jgi:hypothetical protein
LIQLLPLFSRAVWTASCTMGTSRVLSCASANSASAKGATSGQGVMVTACEMPAMLR